MANLRTQAGPDCSYEDAGLYSIENGSPEVHARVLALLKQHGSNALSFHVLKPGLKYWFCGDRACIAFYDSGKAWVAAAGPVAAAPDIPAVIAEFVAFALRCGRRPAFFGVRASRAAAAGLSTVKIGQTPVWDPRVWPEHLKRRRSLREQLRRARAKGVSVRRLEGSESSAIAAIERLTHSWRQGQLMSSMAFLAQLVPFVYPSERRYLVAERDGRIVGALIMAPVYAENGWAFDDILRERDAPNGTAELLIDEGMRLAACEGCCYATLGFTPLAGVHSGWLARARSLGNWIYNFEGLYAFRAKQQPDRWDDLHLAFPPGVRVTTAFYDSLVAFADGSLWNFAWRTARHNLGRVGRAMSLPFKP